jgi:MFS family permease
MKLLTDLSNTILETPALLQKKFTQWLHIDLTRKSQRNGYFLIIEIFFATFLTAAASFNAAYAIRLGAGDEQISILTSIPALIAVIIAIPVGTWLQRTAGKKTLLMRSLALHRAGFVVIALVPFLSSLNLNQGTMVVWLLILFTVPAQVFNIGFVSLTATLIRPEQRAAVFSLRNQIFFAVNSVCSFLFGMLLDVVIFPLNYQIMYFASFLLSLVSILYLMKIEFRERAYTAVNLQQSEKPKKKLPTLNVRQRVLKLVNDFRASPTFLKFNINTFLMDFGLWAVIPLFTVFYLNELNATEGWLGLLAATGSVTTIIGFGLSRKLINRHGRKKVLLFTALLRPLFPLVVAIFPNLTAILLLNMAMGILMPGLGLSHYNMMLDATPDARRDEYTAYYTMFQNISVFVAPLVGALIYSLVGYTITFLIFAGVRLVGGLSWYLFPLRELEELPGIPDEDD